ncbi:hypothetical protein QQF64_016176 [Cirrhinus molitorella]|uniref:Uncharacterized protein n=1 Tax=Cirrhinus molitorella TaxID=172907 RepID=A0ABR3LQQ7_9TELE
MPRRQDREDPITTSSVCPPLLIRRLSSAGAGRILRLRRGAAQMPSSLAVVWLLAPSNYVQLGSGVFLHSPFLMLQ